MWTSTFRRTANCFQSRLGYATSDQVATVQLSTDGGVSWPVAVYSQPGTGDAGESVFSLREVDLGAGYAGQQVRVRFYYDHVGGARIRRRRRMSVG